MTLTASLAARMRLASNSISANVHSGASSRAKRRHFGSSARHDRHHRACTLITTSESALFASTASSSSSESIGTTGSATTGTGDEDSPAAVVIAPGTDTSGCIFVVAGGVTRSASVARGINLREHLFEEDGNKLVGAEAERGTSGRKAVIVETEMCWRGSGGRGKKVTGSYRGWCTMTSSAGAKKPWVINMFVLHIK